MKQITKGSTKERSTNIKNPAIILLLLCAIAFLAVNIYLILNPPIPTSQQLNCSEMPSTVYLPQDKALVNNRNESTLVCYFFPFESEDAMKAYNSPFTIYHTIQTNFSGMKK